MSAVAELGDRLSKLTIAEAAELKNYLKEKYQIEPAAGGVMMAPGADAGGGGGAAAAAPAAEPTEFNVILEGADAAKKINVIKVVRELTGQGLAEAKGTVEGAPKPIKEGVNKDEAENIKKKFTEAGATVRMTLNSVFSSAGAAAAPPPAAGPAAAATVAAAALTPKASSRPLTSCDASSSESVLISSIML